MYDDNVYNNLIDSIINNNLGYSSQNSSSVEKLRSYYSKKFKPFLEAIINEQNFSIEHLINCLSKSKDERHKFILESIKRDFAKDIALEKTIEEIFKPDSP
ncbi:MAG: hypothetical protein AB1571_00010 [Nanoarchaeota archaeon]